MAEIAKNDRIKLHIGAHRTGTTSLQAALHGQRPNLSAQGVGYWGPYAMRNKRFPEVFKSYGTQPLSDEELDRIDIIAKSNIALLEKRLENQRRQGHGQIILSEENILGTIRINCKSSRLYADAPHRLAVFSRIFGPYISRVSLTIRSYDAHWRSQMSYWLAHGGNVPTPRKLQSLADLPLRWLDVVENVSTAFPDADIRVMPFEGWITDHKAHIDAIYGASLGLPDQKVAPKNASKSTADLRKALLERRGTNEAERLGAAQEVYQPFSRAQIAHMQALYADDLAALKRGRLARVKLLMPGETG